MKYKQYDRKFVSIHNTYDLHLSLTSSLLRGRAFVAIQTRVVKQKKPLFQAALQLSGLTIISR